MGGVIGIMVVGMGSFRLWVLEVFIGNHSLLVRYIIVWYTIIKRR